MALISPTMTAALIIPVMYSNTGDWSWLSYALGTVMLLFVAYNLNQFAKRSTDVRLDVRLYLPRPGPDRRRDRRLVADLGLSRHLDGRRHRLHDLRRQAAGDDGDQRLALSAVRGLRRGRLVLRLEECRSSRRS